MAEIAIDPRAIGIRNAAKEKSARRPARFKMSFFSRLQAFLEPAHLNEEKNGMRVIRNGLVSGGPQQF